MTSELKLDDKIFNMYRQYQDLITKVEGVKGVEELASNLTVAHMLDHVVCLLKSKNEESVEGKQMRQLSSEGKGKYKV